MATEIFLWFAELHHEHIKSNTSPWMNHEDRKIKSDWKGVSVIVQLLYHKIRVFFLRDVLILLSSIFIRQTFFFFARMFRRIKPVSCYLLIMFSSNTCSFGEKLKFKSSISRNSQKMKNQGVMCLYQKNKNSAPLRAV